MAVVAVPGQIATDAPAGIAQPGFGARAQGDAEIGVGITGVAGPGGGTEEKPVGYVCICVVDAAGKPVAGNTLSAALAASRRALASSSVRFER